MLPEPGLFSKELKGIFRNLRTRRSQNTPLQERTYRDVESLEDVPLVPGIGKTENMLRWGFIKKVYGIIACQLLLTAIVAAIIYTVQPVQNFVLGSVAFQITFAVLPLIGELFLWHFIVLELTSTSSFRSCPKKARIRQAFIHWEGYHVR